MAKPLTSWLVPSFSQHNLRLVVSEFRDVVYTFKWRSFRINLHVYGQVNSPNSWEKFQICCTDMYLIRFLPNFAALRRREIPEALPDYELHHIYKLATKNLHLATTFLQLVAKRRPEDFFNFEPWEGENLPTMKTLFTENSSKSCYTMSQKRRPARRWFP